MSSAASSLIAPLHSPVTFEPVGLVTNVFFDDRNCQVFSVRSGGATGIISRGFVDEHNSTFRLADQGPICTIKLSPDQKVLAVQRNKTDVQFIGVNQLGSNGIFDSRQYSQAIKAKNAVIMGFSWTGASEIAYFGTTGIEIYSVLQERRVLKSLRSQGATIAWYSFCPKSGICLSSPTSSTNFIQPYSIRNSYIYKMPKIEFEKGEEIDIKDKDVVLISIYEDRRYVAVVLNRPHQSSEIHLFAVSKDHSSLTRSHVLRVPANGGIAINVVDNLILVHHQPSATSYVYDVAAQADFDGTVHRHSPVCTANVRAPASAGSAVELYSQNWVTFQPDIVVDAKIGIMWKVKLDLKVGSCLSAVPNLPSLVAFLQQREGAKMILVDVLLERCLASDGASIRAIGAAFDHVNQEYRRHLDQVMQNNLALPASSFPASAFKSYSAGQQTSANKQPMARTVLEQSDLYTNVFTVLAENREVGLKRVLAIVMEYYRSLSANQIPPQHFLNELLINLLVQQKSWFQLHQLLQYHVISDSKPIACLLLSLESVYPPSYQLALDMLSRLGNSKDEICEILLSEKKVLASAKYAAKNALDTNVLPPRKFLEAAVETEDKTMFYNVYHYFLETQPQRMGDKYRSLYNDMFAAKPCDSEAS